MSSDFHGSLKHGTLQNSQNTDQHIMSFLSLTCICTQCILLHIILLLRWGYLRDEMPLKTWHYTVWQMLASNLCSIAFPYWTNELSISCIDSCSYIISWTYIIKLSISATQCNPESIFIYHFLVYWLIFQINPAQLFAITQHTDRLNILFLLFVTLPVSSVW
jgi:hypothetical protein